MLYLVISAYNTDMFTTLTFNQYGNPNLQSQNADYTNFNGPQTLINLQNAGYGQSLQAILLRNGKLARAFDVNKFTSSNSNLIQNFFLQITVDISKCNPCFDYPCNGLNCQAPVNKCGCDGVKNSGATLDPDGRCCLASQKDCIGYCSGRSAGNYNYDTCGVCTLNGARSSLCVLDPCNNKYYLTAKPNVPYVFNGCDDAFAAGYVVQNPDLLNQFNSTSGPIKTKADICAHYNNNGRFENRFTCTFDVDYYNTVNGVSTGLTHFFTRSPPRTGAQCVPGSRTRASPILKNDCSVCVPFPDNAPFCVKDCKDIWRANPAEVWFYDNCNTCVLNGTDPNAQKDDCDVCNGGNALKNECGVCGGVKGNDSCGQLNCLNLTCTKDCDGVDRNPLEKQIDECGNCVWKTDVRDSNCVQDCKNIWYMNNETSPNHVDECQNCVPSSLTRAPTCVQDCKNVWGGNATYDNCNQCLNPGETPPYQCLQDCAGNYYRDGKDSILQKMDDCGECNLLENMNKLKDVCGMCTNVEGYSSTIECTQDCKGNYYLADSVDCLNTQTCHRAFIDDCGDCWFSNETEKRNFKMDHCGFCPDNPLYNKADDCGREIKCPSTSIGNANYSTTLAGNIALGKCDDLYYGSPTLYCNSTGYWNQTITGNPCSSTFPFLCSVFFFFWTFLSFPFKFEKNN